MSKNKAVKLSLYCTCGDSAHASGNERDIERFRDIWNTEHAGVGHGPCDSKTAAKARRKQEQRADHGL